MSDQYRNHQWSIGTSTPGCFSHQNDIYMSCLGRIGHDLSGARVLEVGAGDGEFAFRTAQKHAVREYVILDLPENLTGAVSRARLACDNVIGVPVEQNETLFQQEFDLFVSNICLPETPKTYREALLNNVIPHCKSAMVLGQLSGPWDPDGSYEGWLTDLFRSVYSTVIIEPIQYADCRAVIGFGMKIA